RCSKWKGDHPPNSAGGKRVEEIVRLGRHLAGEPGAAGEDFWQIARAKDCRTGALAPAQEPSIGRNPVGKLVGNDGLDQVLIGTDCPRKKARGKGAVEPGEDDLANIARQ